MAGNEGSENLAGSTFSRRDRPWLLPYNRRLRHLQGITIRNLTLAHHVSGRLRGKTIDDDALPNTLKSPTKLLTQRDTTKLEHSRSSTDLRPIKEADRTGMGIKNGQERKSSSRPSFARLRRRSTMEWSGASPLARQKKLEDVIGERMADTFFSLHVADSQGEPIYVSEVVDKAMNPDFRFFELKSYGPGVTRLSTCTVKVWVKSEVMRSWQYLIELTVNLRSLQFIGKTLGNFHHPLPQNCVLFYLEDGIYTSFTDMPAEEPSSISFGAPVRTLSGARLLTSSYDALMRLSTLDDCIQDALSIRQKLSAQISGILDEHKQPLAIVNQVDEAQESLKAVEAAVATQKKRLEVARRKREELRASIQARRKAVEEGRDIQSKAQSDVAEATEKLKRCQSMLLQVGEGIVGQRRRICEDVSRIYPIEPIPNRPLAFTIRGLPLPNSDFDDVKEDVVSAALGHVTHVVYLLSFYLSCPLPYPVQPYSSISVIQDPISMTTGSRQYPLFMKGTVRYRFEYGVFLLNKDIEILSNRLSLKVLDIRQTLPNLKYLLYIATAGKGELPARKAGGIRGLLRGRETPSMSRTQSQESHAPNTANGSVKTMTESSNAPAAVKSKERIIKSNGTVSQMHGSFQQKGASLRPIKNDIS